MRNDGGLFLLLLSCHDVTGASDRPDANKLAGWLCESKVCCSYVSLSTPRGTFVVLELPLFMFENGLSGISTQIREKKCNVMSPLLSRKKIFFQIYLIFSQTFFLLIKSTVKIKLNAHIHSHPAGYHSG